MRNRKRTMAFCLVMGIFILGGCRNSGYADDKGPVIFYLNMEGNSLVREPYDEEELSGEDAVQIMIDYMKENPDSIEYKSVFPEDVEVEAWELKDQKLDLHFSQSYLDMTDSEEVLFRAAMVQSLGQIQGVNSIMFYVEQDPVLDSAGEPIGYMRPDDFIQNTGSAVHSYQKTKLKLYFGNKKGDQLVEEEVNVRYNSNLSIEKVIVEQLIKGPKDADLVPLIPAETKVIGISVKEGICYVNLSEHFLNNTYGADPELVVYSIVNSVVEGGNASRVQISVNGENDVHYMDQVDLGKPLVRDLDLVEDS